MRGIAETIAIHAPTLLLQADVRLVYEGRDAEGRPCIVIGVRRRTPELEQQLPSMLGGHPVRIEETGEIAPR